MEGRGDRNKKREVVRDREKNRERKRRTAGTSVLKCKMFKQRKLVFGQRLSCYEKRY